MVLIYPNGIGIDILELYNIDSLCYAAVDKLINVLWLFLISFIHN
jgi:hypothetical protein